MPLVDEQQSYTLLSIKEIDDQTIMTFQRPMQSCDYQDFHITVRLSNDIIDHRHLNIQWLILWSDHVPFHSTWIYYEILSVKDIITLKNLNAYYTQPGLWFYTFYF